MMSGLSQVELDMLCTHLDEEYSADAPDSPIGASLLARKRHHQVQCHLTDASALEEALCPQLGLSQPLLDELSEKWQSAEDDSPSSPIGAAMLAQKRNRQNQPSLSTLCKDDDEQSIASTDPGLSQASLDELAVPSLPSQFSMQQSSDTMDSSIPSSPTGASLLARKRHSQRLHSATSACITAATSAADTNSPAATNSPATSASDADLQTSITPPPCENNAEAAGRGLSQASLDELSLQSHPEQDHTCTSPTGASLLALKRLRQRKHAASAGPEIDLQPSIVASLSEHSGLSQDMLDDLSMQCLPADDQTCTSPIGASMLARKRWWQAKRANLALEADLHQSAASAFCGSDDLTGTEHGLSQEMLDELAVQGHAMEDPSSPLGASLQYKKNQRRWGVVTVQHETDALEETAAVAPVLPCPNSWGDSGAGLSQAELDAMCGDDGEEVGPEENAMLRQFSYGIFEETPPLAQADMVRQDTCEVALAQVDMVRQDTCEAAPSQVCISSEVMPKPIAPSSHAERQTSGYSVDSSTAPALAAIGSPCSSPPRRRRIRVQKVDIENLGSPECKGSPDKALEMNPLGTSPGEIHSPQRRSPCSGWRSRPLNPVGLN